MFQMLYPPAFLSTYNNKDEVNNPKNHNQYNTHQASSKKFRQIIYYYLCIGFIYYTHTHVHVSVPHYCQYEQTRMAITNEFDSLWVL